MQESWNHKSVWLSKRKSLQKPWVSETMIEKMRSKLKGNKTKEGISVCKQCSEENLMKQEKNGGRPDAMN